MLHYTVIFASEATFNANESKCNRGTQRKDAGRKHFVTPSRRHDRAENIAPFEYIWLKIQSSTLLRKKYNSDDSLWDSQEVHNAFRKFQNRDWGAQKERSFSAEVRFHAVVIDAIDAFQMKVK